MTATIQEMLLDLFQLVTEDPDHIPAMPIEGIREDSQEQRLLASFHQMLERLQQSKQQAEAALREKEEQYRSIFEASTDGLFIQELADGRVVEVNPAACKIPGFTHEEFLGLLPNDFIHPDSFSLLTESLQTIQAGGQYHARGIAKRKDGTPFNAEAHVTTFEYKGRSHLLSIVRDITEQIRAEKQLREKEEEYRSIFEATSDGLFITDFDDGHLVEVNPAAYKMHGYSYEEFLALHPTAFIHPDSHPLFPEYLQTVKAGGQFHAEALHVRKDGTIFPVEVYGTSFIYRGKPHVLGIVRDISKRVEAEKQLREREAQYRSVFEATSDGLIIRNMDGFVVEANPAACNMHGYAYEEFIGLHRTDIIDPEDHAMVAEYMKAIRAGQSFLGQAVDLRKDGTRFPVEVRGTTFTYQGKPHTLSVLRDITERVEGEKQLREREEQYRSVFEATDDGLTITDLDGYFIEVNPAYCSMLGYTRKELIGLHYSQMTFPEYYPVLDESVQTIQAGGQYQTQGLARRKDGSPLPVEAHATPFIYKGKPHVLGVVRDIIERVEAEQKLREKEEQYRSIFEAASDAMFIANLDGHIVEVNPAACQMYGYSHQEFIGLPTTATIHPDYHHLMAESLQIIQGGGQVPNQLVALRKDGTTFPVEARGTAFTYLGKPHILGIARDITERVQAQHILERRVEERTRELSTLLEVSHNVASTIDLKTLLDLILDQLKVVVDYVGSAITILEGEDLVLVGTQGPESEEHLVQHRFPLKYMGPIWEALCRGELVVVDNILLDTPMARAYRETVGGLLETTFRYIRSWVAVPLKLKDRVIGMLSVSHSQPDFYTPHHAELALAIANQAAIAIENARLYAQAQELAALEERQKLARELHDSVSQALYGISLGAHAARTALNRDPDHVSEPLDYILSLTEAALAEMRALIFELRPESLETEGLVAALSKQAAAVQARHGIAVSLDLCDEPRLSLQVKQDLYRIAQEAMHNTVKHARASTLNVRLGQTPEALLLEVRDDGVGFDAMASFPGHLGLHSMQERVALIGGTCEIESSAGTGTCLRIRISAAA